MSSYCLGAVLVLSPSWSVDASSCCIRAAFILYSFSMRIAFVLTSYHVAILVRSVVVLRLCYIRVVLILSV